MDVETIADAQYAHSLWGHGVARAGWDHWRYQKASSDDALGYDVQEGHAERCESEDEMGPNDDPPDSGVDVLERQTYKKRRRNGVDPSIMEKDEAYYGMFGNADRITEESLKSIARELARAYLRHPRRSARYDARVEAMLTDSSEPKRLKATPFVMIPAHPSSDEIRAQDCYIDLEAERVEIKLLAEEAGSAHRRYLKWKMGGTMRMQRAETHSLNTTKGSDRSARLRYLSWKLGR